MIYLIGSIFLSAVLFVIFSNFKKYKVDLLQAIVVNYFVAAFCGFIMAKFNGEIFSFTLIVNTEWFKFAFFIGALFISIFNLMGISSQKSGIAITSVANKMSVALTVAFGILILHEEITIWKLFGILLAAPALWLTLYRNNEANEKSSYWFPVILFFSSAVLDMTLGYSNVTFVSEKNAFTFTATLFSCAAIVGVVYLGILLLIGKTKFKIKSIVGGIILGVPNFASILFVFLGMYETQMPVSVFFPVMNIGVVVLTALFAVLFIRENLTKLNLIGILLSLISIALISLL